MTLTALCGGRRFLDEYGHALLPVVESGLPCRLGAIITTISSHATDQVLHRMRADGHVSTQHMLRTALSEYHMTAVVRIARADLPHTPEFKVLRTPAGRTTVLQLASAATAMACTAERFADIFIAAGMQVDFIDQFHAAIRALTDARRDATMARARQHGVTRAIATMIVEGNKTLGDLDKLIAVELRHNAALYANWQTVTAKPRRGRPRG